MIKSEVLYNQYIWDGASEETFDITFDSLEDVSGTPQYIRVVIVDRDTGVIADITETVTVSGKQITVPPVADPGPEGYRLVISRVAPFTQAIDLLKNGVTDLNTLERMVDKLTVLCQQLKAELETAIHASEGDLGGGGDLVLPPIEQRKDTVFTFDEFGSPLMVTYQNDNDGLLFRHNSISYSVPARDANGRMNVRLLVSEPGDLSNGSIWIE